MAGGEIPEKEAQEMAVRMILVRAQGEPVVQTSEPKLRGREGADTRSSLQTDTGSELEKRSVMGKKMEVFHSLKKSPLTFCPIFPMLS